MLARSLHSQEGRGVLGLAYSTEHNASSQCRRGRRRHLLRLLCSGMLRNRSHRRREMPTDIESCGGSGSSRVTCRFPGMSGKSRARASGRSTFLRGAYSRWTRCGKVCPLSFCTCTYITCAMCRTSSHNVRQVHVFCKETSLRQQDLTAYEFGREAVAPAARTWGGSSSHLPCMLR